MRVRARTSRKLGRHYATRHHVTILNKMTYASSGKMKPNVFISVGSVGAQCHIKASEGIFRTLETAGLSPRQLDKNEWPAEQPLRAIKKIIRECDGIVVIAFARYRFPIGIELKDGGAELSLTDVRFPTVWNQIEASMAYATGLPLLVVAERGLREDGLLQGRYEWRVYWTDFSDADLKSEAFLGYLESWKGLVAENVATRVQKADHDIDVSKLTLAQLLGQLRVPQLWAVIAVISTLLGGLAIAAYQAGAHKWFQK